MSDHTNSFSIKEKTYKYYDLKSLDSEKVDRLPFTHKILLENALRHAENDHEGPKDVETILNWNPKSDQFHQQSENWVVFGMILEHEEVRLDYFLYNLQSLKNYGTF